MIYCVRKKHVTDIQYAGLSLSKEETDDQLSLSVMHHWDKQNWTTGNHRQHQKKKWRNREEKGLD